MEKIRRWGYVNLADLLKGPHNKDQQQWMIVKGQVITIPYHKTSVYFQMVESVRHIHGSVVGGRGDNQGRSSLFGSSCLSDSSTIRTSRVLSGSAMTKLSGVGSSQGSAKMGKAEPNNIWPLFVCCSNSTCVPSHWV